MPLEKTITAVLEPQPVSARLAGEWLGQRPDLADVPLLSNERKIPFYAGRGQNFEHLEFKSTTSLVRKSLRPGEKLVSILVRAKDKAEVPPLRGYINIAEFKDDKYVSLIYHKRE